MMKMKLKEIRTKKGYSRNHLSRISGVAQETIYKLESGKTPYTQAKLETFVLLAKALKVKVVDLIPEIK